MRTSTIRPKRRSASRAALAALAIFSIVSAVAAAPILQTGEMPTSEFTLTTQLSKEMSRLGRTASQLSIVVRCPREGSRRGSYKRGLYLGDGLVVTPHVEAIRRGASAQMRTRNGDFRLRALVSLKSPMGVPLCTFFRLHDPHATIEPARGTPVAPDWREQLGDLVFVRGWRMQTFAMVSRSFGLNPRRSASPRSPRGATRGDTQSSKPGAPKSRARQDARYLHLLALESCEPGATVLASDGSVVGMVVDLAKRPRSSESKRATPSTQQGKEKGPDAKDAKQVPQDARRNAAQGRRPNSEKGVAGSGSKVDEKRRKKKDGAERPRRSVYAVLDTSWLLARGKLALEDGLPGQRPSIGISISLKSKVVSIVYRGSPAEAAGVERRDKWLEINGQPFEKDDQLQTAIKAGKPIEIRYQRRVAGGSPIKSVYRIIPR